MKIRHLPELDLARIAPLSASQKRAALEGLRLGRPPYSYDPMRRSTLDLLNIAAGPLISSERASWHSIEGQIRRLSRTTEEANANVGVASAIYKFTTARALEGRRHEIFPLNIGFVEKVSYWTQAVIGLEGRPTVPFIDPRRSTKRLTEAARRFVFSVMHERFLAEPDLADVELCIMQFETGGSGERMIRLHHPNDIKLFSFDELDMMVQETYALWYEILEERDEKGKRKTGTGGSLI